MTKIEIKKQNRSLLVVPLSILFLLIAVTFISIIQGQHEQSLKSKADTATPTATIQSCSISNSQMNITQSEQTFFDKINQFRQDHDQAPLVWSPTLQKATVWMSNDMLISNKLSHTDSLGRNLETRLANCGFSSPTVIGENIDSGSSDTQVILSSWETSPAQVGNILNSSFTQGAVSLATNSSGTQAFWTFDFAGQIPTPILSPTLAITPTIAITASPTHPIAPSVTSSPTTTPFPTLISTPSPTLFPTTSVLTAYPTTSGISLLPTLPYSPSPTPFPPTPTTVPGFILNPLDTQLFVSIKLPSIGTGGGIGSNMAPKHFTRLINVHIIDMNNREVLVGQGFVKFDGNLFRGLIHLGQLNNGSYYIKISSNYLLTQMIEPEFQVISNSKLNILPEVSLPQGDINSDNVLDIKDYDLAVACFQKAKSCLDPTIVDFNDDGISNIYDYNILLQNFTQYEGD